MVLLLSNTLVRGGRDRRDYEVPVCSNDSSCGIRSTPWYWVGEIVCSNGSSCGVFCLFGRISSVCEFYKIRGTDSFPTCL